MLWKSKTSESKTSTEFKKTTNHTQKIKKPKNHTHTKKTRNHRSQEQKQVLNFTALAVLPKHLEGEHRWTEGETSCLEDFDSKKFGLQSKEHICKFQKFIMQKLQTKIQISTKQLYSRNW